jgi:hypothetical protein
VHDGRQFLAGRSPEGEELHQGWLPRRQPDGRRVRSFLARPQCGGRSQAVRWRGRVHGHRREGLRRGRSRRRPGLRPGDRCRCGRRTAGQRDGAQHEGEGQLPGSTHLHPPARRPPPHAQLSDGGHANPRYAIRKPITGG